MSDELKVQNIVATTSLGKEISLTTLAKTQLNTEYNPEQFPGLVLRIKQPKSAVLVFSSGNLVCTGTKSMSPMTVPELTSINLKEKLFFLGFYRKYPELTAVPVTPQKATLFFCDYIE